MATPVQALLLLPAYTGYSTDAHPRTGAAATASLVDAGPSTGAAAPAAATAATASSHPGAPGPRPPSSLPGPLDKSPHDPADATGGVWGLDTLACNTGSHSGSDDSGREFMLVFVVSSNGSSGASSSASTTATAAGLLQPLVAALAQRFPPHQLVSVVCRVEDPAGKRGWRAEDLGLLGGQVQPTLGYRYSQP